MCCPIPVSLRTQSSLETGRDVEQLSSLGKLLSKEQKTSFAECGGCPDFFDSRVSGSFFVFGSFDSDAKIVQINECRKVGLSMQDTWAKYEGEV